MNKVTILSLFLSLFIATNIFAQTGKVAGTIVDSKTGETLPGAMALIEGTGKGAMADFDGKFIISGVAVGKATLVVSYISYDTKKVTDVDVKANDVTNVNVQLSPSTSQELAEVTVVVTLNKENNTALILQQKNNASVSDGISAETIKKTPDRNTSDVLKRISGASIQENKFAIIRGLNDRYNAAYINGAPLPSSESDRKAFAFDIFPANMLDNLVIIKTATPEMPADFAGGIININTKNIPEKNFYNISIGSSYHTLTTFKNFKTYEGGKYDWLGFDDGSRALPGEVPSTKDFPKLIDEKAELAKVMTPSWKIDSDKKASLPINLQFSMGQNLKLFKNEFGVLFAYTYRNSFNRSQSIRNEYEESATDTIQKIELIDTVYSKTVLNSSLLNFAYKIGQNNQFSFKNMLSINSEDKLSIRKGVRELDNDPHFFEKSSNRWFTQNRIYSGQLEGTHLIAKPKIKIVWNGGYSDVRRKIPNLRRVVYQKTALEENDTTTEYFAIIQNNGTIPTAAGNMFWADTKENIKSFRLSISKQLDFINVQNEFKIGGMYQQRDRQFDVRNLGFSRYRKSGIVFDNSLLTMSEDSIFDPSHLGLISPGVGGFKLEEATKLNDSYKAGSKLFAGFIMTDTRIFEKLRVVGGLRVESYFQNLSYIEPASLDTLNLDSTVVDYLPSANLIYSLNEKINIRASFYKTVSRPEFREIAPFAFYNFVGDNILSGNPQLKRTAINNFDLRFELYPGAGQVLSVTGFYKDFENAIELIMRPGTSGAPELYYQNIEKVTSYGGELDYRFKLGTLFKSDSSIFLNNTTFFTNMSLIKSVVDISKIIGAIGTERPMQGQSKYILNGGVQFIHPEKNYGFIISYNVVGPRIYIVWNTQ
ncbi:MAG: TonB-dependent receptor [Bacteroidia bacterium]